MTAILIDVFLDFLIIVIEKSTETAKIMKKYIAENESKIRENDKKTSKLLRTKVQMMMLNQFYQSCFVSRSTTSSHMHLTIFNQNTIKIIY